MKLTPRSWSGLGHKAKTSVKIENLCQVPKVNAHAGKPHDPNLAKQCATEELKNPKPLRSHLLIEPSQKVELLATGDN